MGAVGVGVWEPEKSSVQTHVSDELTTFCSSEFGL